ncbi:MAG: hypothetical protein AAGJ08_19785, partial [Cyanobacteria bacterium P01_H01_bin.35]
TSVKNYQHFHSLKLLKKVRRVEGIFPGAMAEKFSSGEAPTRQWLFSLVKFFHPSYLGEKSPIFSFSEAFKKIGSSGDRSFHSMENHQYFHSLKLPKKTARIFGCIL